MFSQQLIFLKSTSSRWSQNRLQKIVSMEENKKYMYRGTSLLRSLRDLTNPRTHILLARRFYLLGYCSHSSHVGDCSSLAGDVMRLILMRIRFRASDVGSSRENKSRSRKSKQASSARSDAEMVCSCDSAGRSWIQKIQANVGYCYVWRREETRRVRFARPWTQASKPALTDSSLAAKRRAEAFHARRFKWSFFQPSVLSIA